MPRQKQLTFHIQDLRCAGHIVEELSKLPQLDNFDMSSIELTIKENKPAPKIIRKDIDMLIDRADGAINICEMKYAKDEFVIDASYEQRLRDRMASFSVATKTKKALLHTFITTYGVKQNMHSGLVNSEVRMNDLFG